MRDPSLHRTSEHGQNCRDTVTSSESQEVLLDPNSCATADDASYILEVVADSLSSLRPESLAESLSLISEAPNIETEQAAVIVESSDGFSSLGDCEFHILANIFRVSELFNKLSSRK